MNRYKWSQYVFKFERENIAFLYCSISDSLYKIYEKDWEKLNEFMNDSNEKILNKNQKRFFSELFVDGFIVDSSINEIERVEEILHNRIVGSENGTVYFAPSFSCNLRCEYCIIGKNVNTDNSNLKMSINDSIKSANWVFQMSKKKKIKEVSILLYGGEPTLSFENNVAFMQELNRQNNMADKKIAIRYQMITNGYEKNEKEFMKLLELGLGRVQVTLDGPDFIHDKRRVGINGEKTFSAVLKNALYYKDMLNDVIIRVNVDSTNAKQITKLLDVLVENGFRENSVLHFNLVDPSNYSNTSGYNPETTNEFFDIYSNAFDKGFNVAPWKRYCSLSAKFYFSIDWEGKIYKCPNHMGDSDKIIGTINEMIEQDPYFNVIDSACVKCKYVGICNGGCEVMRKQSYIGKNYCFKDENEIMTKAFYEAQFGDDIESVYSRLLVKRMQIEKNQ